MCEYAPNVYYIRSMLLGGAYNKGPAQPPWDGEKDYDYVMWIDSDIFFDCHSDLAIICSNLFKCLICDK